MMQLSPDRNYDMFALLQHGSVQLITLGVKRDTPDVIGTETA